MVIDIGKICRTRHCLKCPFLGGKDDHKVGNCKAERYGGRETSETLRATLTNEMYNRVIEYWINLKLSGRIQKRELQKM